MATLSPEVEKAVFTGFKADFNQGFQTAQSYIERLATLVNSGARDETYSWLGAIPMLHEWIGERQVKELELHDYSIKNATFESTVKVKREDIEDDRAGVYSPLIRLMGEMAKKHPDKLIFELIRNGMTKSCYDKNHSSVQNIPSMTPSFPTLKRVTGKHGICWIPTNLLSHLSFRNVVNMPLSAKHQRQTTKFFTTTSMSMA